jgi:hypothetical protein
MTMGAGVQVAGALRPGYQPQSKGEGKMIRHHYHGPANEKGWLEAAIDEPAEVVLHDGETLAGILRGNDEHAILLETDAERPTVLIYKREIRLIRR